MKIITVLSGGMDSVTMAYYIKSKGYEQKAISFNYGQRHKKELEAAKKTCQLLDIEHNIIDIRSITSFISNSSLTSNQEVPEGNYADENMKKTVVPSRNTIMASIANGYAINIKYDTIALAVHAGDHTIYPDCRPDFIEALKTLFATNNFERCDVYTPFLYLDKTAIAKIGKDLNVNYKYSWTCYKGEQHPCGKCGSCVERVEAFYENGIKDPLYTNMAWVNAVAYMKKVLNK